MLMVKANRKQRELFVFKLLKNKCYRNIVRNYKCSYFSYGNWNTLSRYLYLLYFQVLMVLTAGLEVIESFTCKFLEVFLPTLFAEILWMSISIITSRDTQPLFSNSFLDRAVQLEKKYSFEYFGAENTIEIHSLQMIGYLMSICHVITFHVWNYVVFKHIL